MGPPSALEMLPRPVSSVLMVRNLEPHHSKEDLAAIFESARGLNRTEMVNKGEEIAAMLYFKVCIYLRVL